MPFSPASPGEQEFANNLTPDRVWRSIWLCQADPGDRQSLAVGKCQPSSQNSGVCNRSQEPNFPGAEKRRIDPSFFRTRKIGLAHGLVEGWITPVFCISFNCRATS